MFKKDIFLGSSICRANPEDAPSIAHFKELRKQYEAIQDSLKECFKDEVKTIESLLFEAMEVEISKGLSF